MSNCLILTEHEFIMNHNVHGTTGVGEDSTMAHSNYGNDGWASLSPYASPFTQSPMNEYTGFFLPQLPSESMSRMPPPPHVQHHQMIQPGPPPSHAVASHQALPMLNTNPTWPSQLTNPSPGPFSAPPLTMTTPLSSATPTETPTRPMSEKPRKTLSTEQKRAMCKYHEENPGARQADIGLKFGVERSTVSKVLRQKEQYLKQDQGQDDASAKRGKAKHPDFDRTLSNFVRRRQQQGLDVKDEEIMEQAKIFARASGKQEAVLSGINSSWLQKFKQKHNVGQGRLMRRASEANIPDSARMSTASRGSKRMRSSSQISPSSPSAQLSPVSGSRSDEDIGESLDYEFTYRQPTGSHSTTSLSSDIRETGNSSFSASTMSPTGVFTFSPDPNTGAFPSTQPHSLQMRASAPELQPREQRSNTFPSLSLENIKPEPVTPRFQPSTTATAPSSAVESPVEGLHPAAFGIDTTLNSPPPTLRRSGSSSSLRQAATPVMGSASVDSSPVSPSQEDARRAANTLLSYIQGMGSNSNFDQSEYMAIVQLTRKLQLHQHQHQSLRPAIGGLSRIPEGDGEIAATAELTMEST